MDSANVRSIVRKNYLKQNQLSENLSGISQGKGNSGLYAFVSESSGHIYAISLFGFGASIALFRRGQLFPPENDPLPGSTHGISHADSYALFLRVPAWGTFVGKNRRH